MSPISFFKLNINDTLIKSFFHSFIHSAITTFRNIFVAASTERSWTKFYFSQWLQQCWDGFLKRCTVEDPSFNLSNNVNRDQPMIMNDRFILRGCSYGGEPAFLVGPALVRGLGWTSLLYRNFLAVLAGLDQARMCHTRANSSEYINMENFESSYARSPVVNSEVSLRRAGPPPM